MKLGWWTVSVIAVLVVCTLCGLRLVQTGRVSAMPALAALPAPVGRAPTPGTIGDAHDATAPVSLANTNNAEASSGKSDSLDAVRPRSYAAQIEDFVSEQLRTQDRQRLVQEARQLLKGQTALLKVTGLVLLLVSGEKDVPAVYDLALGDPDPAVSLLLLAWLRSAPFYQQSSVAFMNEMREHGLLRDAGDLKRVVDAADPSLGLVALDYVYACGFSDEEREVSYNLATCRTLDSAVRFQAGLFALFPSSTPQSVAKVDELVARQGALPGEDSLRDLYDFANTREQAYSTNLYVGPKDVDLAMAVYTPSSLQRAVTLLDYVLLNSNVEIWAGTALSLSSYCEQYKTHLLTTDETLLLRRIESNLEQLQQREEGSSSEP